MIKFEQPNPKTIIINKTPIEFPQSIARVLTLPDRVVILLEMDEFEYGDKMVGRNLLAYGPDGEEIWRVADHGATMRARRQDKVTLPDARGRRRVPQAISFASLNQSDGTIYAALANLYIIVDPKDGKILDMDVRH
jgi:hypothetical protein